MSAITTHVLDTVRGRPAAGIAVVLERSDGDAWEEMGRGTTDGDGRLRSLLSTGAPIAAGTYRLIFETGPWFDGLSTPAFYPRVVVEFTVTADEAHYHVPLLLSPFGYSTYRGS